MAEGLNGVLHQIQNLQMKVSSIRGIQVGADRVYRDYAILSINDDMDM